MAKKIPEEWSQHLTGELREHFKSVGRVLVEQDVAIHRYGASSKYYAALAWLAEQRQADQQRDRMRFVWLLVVGLLTLFVALLGVAVTKGVL